MWLVLDIQVSYINVYFAMMYLKVDDIALDVDRVKDFCQELIQMVILICLSFKLCFVGVTDDFTETSG